MKGLTCSFISLWDHCLSNMNLRLKFIFIVCLLLKGLQAEANVVGADTQNFNPTTDGLDFVTVHSSKTLPKGFFNLGLFLNYAVNSLPNYEDTSSASRTNFSDTLLSADMNLGVGLSERWSAGFSLPYLVSQSVQSTSTFRGEFVRNGITEFRANTKYRVWDGEGQGLAAVASVNFNQIQDNPFTGSNAGPTLNLEGVYDWSSGPWTYGVNAGYRMRNPGAKVAGVPVDPLRNQMIASFATSYWWEEHDLKIIGEIFSSFPTEKSNFASDRSLSSAEALIGVKGDFNRNLAWHAGGGTEIFNGTASPDWRVYTGLNYAFGPMFGDRKDIERSPPTEKDAFEDTPTPQEVFIAREVLFRFNSDEIDPQFREMLKRLASYLTKPPVFKKLVIEGHTDSVGSAEYNIELSQKRAEKTRAVLIEVGLPADRVEAIGIGEARPIASNANFQGRAMNRRVEFRVTR